MVVGKNLRFKIRKVRYRIFLGLFSIAGLILIFLFQQTDVAGLLNLPFSSLGKFIFNRSIRFLCNDGLTVLLIYVLFREMKYVWFAVYVQLFGLLFVLLPYFIIKVYYPLYNGPMINFVHRLVLNPLILMLLIPAFFYQKQLERKR